jgi:hypothetical protein
MTLTEKCKNLRKRIDVLQEVQASSAEFAVFQHRLHEARAMQENISEAVEMTRLLKSESIPFEANGELATKAAKNLGTIIERFSQVREASSLTRGKNWARLSEHSNEINKDFKQQALAAWRTYARALCTSQKPAVLKANLAMTEKNKMALEKYSAVFDEFRSMEMQFPSDSEDIELTARLAEQLIDIAKNFDFEVPNDVKLFLESVAQGGAALELLTDGVVQWLEQNRTYGQYQIIGNRR